MMQEKKKLYEALWVNMINKILSQILRKNDRDKLMALLYVKRKTALTRHFKKMA